jgi:magnesium chelatase subunit D
MSAATRGRLAVLAAQLFAEAPAAFGGLVLRGRASPARAALLEIAKAALASGAPWRRVPAGIDDDRLIGGLDLMAALSDGAARLRPGLLADADGGVAVLASAERMPAARAGRITAALDDGHVQIERDGRSLRSPTQFGFIALDEGEDEERAPPALYERAAFLVDMEGVSAAAVADGPMTIEPGEMVSDDAAIAAIIGCARALGVGSARAPIAALRAARALAGRAGRAGLCAGDLELAAALVLAPRATIAPDAEPTQQDPPPPPPDGPEPDPEDQPDPQDQTAEATPPPQALDDLVVAAARAAIPDQLLAALASGAMRGAGGGQGAQTASKLRGRPIGVRAGLPRNGARLALLATLRAAAPWQRLRRAAAGDRAPSAPVL